MSWEEKRQTQALNYLSCFYRSSNRACSLVSSLQLQVRCETPFQRSPQIGGWNFRLYFHRRRWSSTDCRYVVMSGCQPTLFLFSILHLLLRLTHLSPLQPIKTRCRFCWYVSIFNQGVPNYNTLFYIVCKKLKFHAYMWTYISVQMFLFGLVSLLIVSSWVI